MSPRRKMKVIDTLEEIPQFANEDEEHAFWATHEFSDRLWDQAEPLQPDELPPPRARRKGSITLELDESVLTRLDKLARKQRQDRTALAAKLIVAGLSQQEAKQSAAR